jgi:spore germination cell wall hydrolase CwlJ-like protein
MSDNITDGAPRASTPVANFIICALALVASFYFLEWITSTKLAKYAEAESSPITAAVRERQLACLAKNIYYEAGSEPFEGKVAVAQVTINRTESGQFPADICQTIYQKNVVYEKVICQFSWYCENPGANMKSMNGPVYTESMEVAKKVLLEGFRLPELKHALYFHGDYIAPAWNRQKLIKIGHHIFYK